MAQMSSNQRVRRARRVGMTVVVVAITWTVAAVAVAVLRVLLGGEPNPALTNAPPALVVE